MNRYSSYQELVELLLNAAVKERRDLKPNQILPYRYGYLVGMLAKLAYDDSYVKAEILSRLKKLTNK